MLTLGPTMSCHHNSIVIFCDVCVILITLFFFTNAHMNSYTIENVNSLKAKPLGLLLTYVSST
jgi:hypothetical protein